MVGDSSGLEIDPHLHSNSSQQFLMLLFVCKTVLKLMFGSARFVFVSHYIYIYTHRYTTHINQ